MKSTEEIAQNLEGLEWDEYDLQKDLYVDKHALDEEAMKHPMIQAKWNNALAQAQIERDKAQARFKVKEAELTTRGFGGESPKTTGDAVKAWVRSHPEYEEAYTAFNQAEGAVSHLWGARQSIEAKKNMIETAVRLWGSGYFSTPKVTPEAQEKAQESTSAELRKDLNKTLPKRKVVRRKVKR